MGNITNKVLGTILVGTAIVLAVGFVVAFPFNFFK